MQDMPLQNGRPEQQEASNIHHELDMSTNTSPSPVDHATAVGKVDIDILTTFLDSDPNDTFNPQNWSSHRKTGVFLALMSSSLLCDGAMVWGATLFFAQTLTWHITMAKSTTSVNYGILLQGFGGILAVPLIEHYGRYPVWFWSQFITLGMVIGASLAPSFESFVAFRSLQGLFGTVPQVVGLSVIHDMYSPEDWAYYINIWGATFLVGPSLGPAMAGYINSKLSWEATFGVLAGLYGFSTVLVLVFGRETYYVTHKPISTAPTFIESLLGQGGALAAERPSLARTATTLFKFIFRLPILLVGIATMVNGTWPIGIVVTVDSFIRAPPYLMDSISAASMRWAPIIGALAGWLIGYTFNSYISRTRLHLPNWRPEFRLHGVWIPSFLMVGGLLLYGLGIKYERHWVALAFGWCLVNSGLVGNTVAITSFGLEKYARHATIVSAILNMWRTCGGFSVSYFQSEWIARVGVGVVFGCQAVIFAVLIVALIASTILLGKSNPGDPVSEVSYEARKNTTERV